MDSKPNSPNPRSVLWTSVCLLLITAAIAIVFRPLFFPRDPRDLLGCGDHWLYFGPHAYLMDAAIHRGEFPLWNPLVLCGKPFAANPQSAAFYPPNLLRALANFSPTPFGTHISLAVMVAAHLLGGAWATIFLARRQGLSQAAGFAAACVYAFSANMVARAGAQWSFVAMAAWFPVMLLLLHESLASDAPRRRWRFALHAGLAFGCSILIGFPQLSLYCGVGLVAYALAHSFLGASAPASLRLGARRLAQLLPLLVVIGLLAGAVGSAMLLPARELSSFSPRAKGENVGFSYETTYGNSALDIAEYLTVWPGAEEFMNLRGPGTVAVLLVVAALARGPRRQVALFGFLAYVLVDCAIGPPSPVASLVRWVSPFVFNYPQRAMVLACFPLAMLAGFGLDAVVRGEKSKRPSPTVWCVFCGFVVLLLAGRWFLRHRFLAVSPGVMAIPTAALVIIVAAPWMRRRRAISLMLPALLLLEPMVWAPSYLRHLLDVWPYRESVELLYQHPTWSLSNSRGCAPTSAEMREHLRGQGFGYGESWNNRMFALEPVINGYEPLYLDPVRQVLCAPESEPEYMREVGSWEVMAANARGHLFLKRSFWLARQYVVGPLPGKDRLFPPATTVYLREPPPAPIPQVSASSVPDQGVSEAVERVAVGIPDALSAGIPPEQTAAADLPRFERPEAHSVLRLAYTGECTAQIRPSFFHAPTGNWTLGRVLELPVSDGKERLAEIPLPDFNPVSCHLEIQTNEGPGSLRLNEIVCCSDLCDEDALLRIQHRSANRVDLEIGELPGVRLLVFVDAAYPGWRALVDGKPAPILTANDAFKALALQPGAHEIRFEFRPARVYAGLAISLAALAGALAVAGWLHLSSGPRPPAQRASGAH